MLQAIVLIPVIIFCLVRLVELRKKTTMPKKEDGAFWIGVGVGAGGFEYNDWHS